MRIRAARSTSVSVLVSAELELSASLESEWLRLLPPERRAQIGRWPERRDRQRSLVASRLLAHGLHRLGYPPAKALSSLRYPPRSRPTLDLPVHFSLAHCDGRVVCALSTDVLVGVDVEAFGALTADEFSLYLSAAERAWAGRSARRFYSVWTRKEAVAKAAGSGLPALPRVDTMHGVGVAALAGRLWRTAPIALGRRHVGHVALADLHAAVKVEQVSARALL